jgi:hypothetical protein
MTAQKEHNSNLSLQSFRTRASRSSTKTCSVMYFRVRSITWSVSCDLAPATCWACPQETVTYSTPDGQLPSAAQVSSSAQAMERSSKEKIHDTVIPLEPQDTRRYEACVSFMVVMVDGRCRGARRSARVIDEELCSIIEKDIMFRNVFSWNVFTS